MVVAVYFGGYSNMKIPLVAISAFEALAFPLVMGSTAQAGGMEKLDKVDGERLALIVQGGLLYDKWYAELGLKKPKTTHVSYPKTAK